MALKDPRFLMLNSVMNIFEQIAILGLVTASTIILVISGNFDISVRAVTGLNSCLIAMMMNAGIPIPVAATASILTAMSYAFFNEVLVILFKVPSSIISLATTNVYTGAALCLTKGVIQTVYGKFNTMNRFRLSGAVPLIFIISLMGCVVVGIILRYMQIGRRTFAIGSDERTTFLPDIKVTRNKLVFFAMNGFLVGLAVVLLLSRMGSALPSAGVGYGPQAIGTVVIGGAPINGGKGNIVGTLFDVLPMGLISNVLNILGVNSYLQKIASGALIIISLEISAIRVHILTKN